MAANPYPTAAELRSASPLPLLAADVGGTHVRVGLVHADTDPARPLSILSYRKFACADHASLDDIIETYVAGLDGQRIEEGAIACAGYPLADGSIITVNLPWPVSPRAIRERLGFRALQLVNDFEAVAHAAAEIDASEVLHLSGPASAPSGPTLVAGPGTGFGAAVWIPAPGRPVVLATEAGHAALMPGNELELALLAELLREHDHVPVEHALSGPGLLRLHAALCRLHGRPSDYREPGGITAAALSGDDPDARATLDAFCGLLGSTIGNLALLYGIRGGIYLAGGILPQIRDFLPRSSFVERYLGKGAMRPALERIPVKLVEHGRLGVIGAARWYLGRRQGSQAMRGES